MTAHFHFLGRPEIEYPLRRRETIGWRTCCDQTMSLGLCQTEEFLFGQGEQRLGDESDEDVGSCSSTVVLVCL